MKIALLSEKYTPDIGGLAISAARLARLLTAAGHSVRVFAPSMSLAAGDLRQMNLDGSVIHRFGVHKRTDDTLQAWFELLVRTHRQDPFDLIHAYFLTQAGFVAVFAGNYLGLPTVVSARGNDLERAIFDPARAAHVLFALREASAVTTNSSDLARKARALVPALDVRVIPNGIDIEIFRPLPRSPNLRAQIGFHSMAPGAGEDGAIIGFVGELREKKGLDALVRGYTQVGEKRPAGLLITGQLRAGDDQRRFDELTQSNPNGRIVITGYVPPADLPAYYAQMDVFVHPSRRDGLPNAVLEAMACELPVIATPVGGIAELITDRVNGRIVPPDEPDHLAAAMEELLNDRDAARKYGQAARRTVQERYTVAAELEGNLRVYKDLGLPV